jgi:predicted aspartyl protease
MQMLAGATVALFVAMMLAVVVAQSRAATKLPLSERIVRRMFQAAGWLQHLAAALDSAIVRYRLERMRERVELESTWEREARRRAA